jgi:integrase
VCHTCHLESGHGLEGDKTRGSYVDHRQGRVSFADFFEHFLETAPLRPSTRALYDTHGRLYLLPACANRPLATIAPRDVRTLLGQLQKRGARSGTIDPVFQLLRRVLNLAVEEERITRNVATRVRTPRSARREPRFLTAEEVDALANAVPAQYRSLNLAPRLHRPSDRGGTCAPCDDLDLLRGRVHVQRAAVEVGGRRFVGETKRAR